MHGLGIVRDSQIILFQTLVGLTQAELGLGILRINLQRRLERLLGLGVFPFAEIIPPQVIGIFRYLGRLDDSRLHLIAGFWIHHRRFKNFYD